MNITDSPIWAEVQSVINNDSTESHNYWECQIVIGEETIDPYKLVSIDGIRQYDDNYADETIVRIVLTNADYQNKIIPNKDSLLISLFREPTAEISADVDLDRPRKVRTYRAILIDSRKDTLISSGENNVSDSPVDTLMDCEIQLIDLSVEQLRMKSVGGIYRDMTTTDVVRGVLSASAGSLSLDEESSLDGVTIVPGNNQEVRNHTIIPYGTPLMKVPKYVQENCGGVYGTGIRHYIQGAMWYVFPRYNTKRFEETSKVLTVVNLPENLLPGIERTYFVSDDAVMAISTGSAKEINVSEKLQLNEGNGIRYVNARQYIGGFFTVDGNKAMANRDDNVTEIALNERSSGLNQAPLSEQRITDNPYNETSKLAPRIGTNLQVEWENADPDLIYPGMPVRYLYVDGDSIGVVYGLVTAADYYVQLDGQGMTVKRHRCNVTLTIYVEQPKSE